MPENIERPPDTATNNAKARWSALKALRENPDGLPKAELDERVRRDWPGDFEGRWGSRAVGGALQSLTRVGLVHRDADAQEWKADEVPQSAKPPQTEEEGKAREPGWYEPVAEALVSMGLCTIARPSGNNLNGPKWTNPDVVGRIVPEPHALQHNFPTRLVAVEIKRAIDTTSLLTGFAEACAYLDFAHISWLVVPWWEEYSEAIVRVERLCVAHGLGLAYAWEKDQDGGKDLGLAVGVHPRCHKPGAREFNEFLKRLEKANVW